MAAFLCSLEVFWCKIPRDPYMVKAKRECEAQGKPICYHSQRLQRKTKGVIQEPGQGKVCVCVCGCVCELLVLGYQSN